jgi:DNA end-binding protein Ku
MPRFSASWKFGRGHYVVDLIEALRKSVGGASAETDARKKSAKKPR